MQKKKLWIGIIAFVLVIAAVTTGWLLYDKQQLEENRNAALEELERNIGQYDEQSIVLYETSKAKAEELAELYGAKLRITSNGRFATLTLPEGTTIRDVYAMKESLRYIDEMAADYQVQVSELTEEEDGERLPMRPQYSVSDTDYELQTYLDYLNMGEAWNRYTGSGVTIAVIDTGIDTDHPEFAGRISEYSYNATEDKIVKDWLLEDGSYDWSLIEDEQGHGTAVTGVLAASMDGEGIVGIAPDVNIIVIKAECDANGNFARTSDLVFGLYYAIERDVQVVNMSFGTNNTVNPFAEATQLAVDSDIICVAAAGNEAVSSMHWPAADKNVIGVGALGDGWKLADYSNYGENINLVAPGTTYTTRMGGQYGVSAGTSLASPIVAGAIALYMQQDKYTTLDEVTQLLHASCYDLGDLGRDWYYGFGALDISAFLLEQRGTIHFDMLTNELENEDGIFIQGHTLQELPEPERLYAVFDGWYYDDTFTQKYHYYEDKLYGEVTLYAKWSDEENSIPYTYVILDDGTVEIRSYTGHRKYITIPEMIEGRIVTSVGDFAFYGQSKLREVVLPSGLTHIGMYAFANCSGLLGIEIPENVTTIDNCAFADNVRLPAITFQGDSQLERIGEQAFQGCISLESIQIPENVREIGKYAFERNLRLSSVGFGENSQLEIIGSGAFSGCARLTQIHLPASLQNIDGSAFSGVTALRKITVQKGNSHFASKDGVLFDDSGSTLVAFPAAYGDAYSIPKGTVTIGQYAFAYGQIREIDLAGVQSVADYAFLQAAVETLILPDSVTSIGKGAFASMGHLTQLSIGSGLTRIPEETFSDAVALKTVTIPNTITSIGKHAFSGSGLESIFFEEESTLTSIGGFAFADCRLKGIDIPASVIVVDDNAFYGDSWLARVGFADDAALQTIGQYAFAGCWELKTMELPDGLRTIGRFAFRESGLTTLTLPAGLTELGDGAFALCNNLSALTVDSGNTAFCAVDGVLYTLDLKTLHTYPAGREGAYYTLESNTQTIAPWAFAGANALVSAQLPDSLVQLSEYGFAYCSQLRYLYIPENVVNIGRYCFAADWNLHSVSFAENAKMERISYGSFAYCGITSFTVPANVSTMAQYAFANCPYLTDITFAENSSLESLPAYLFESCGNLESIVFQPGSALSNLQAHALHGMDKLTIVDFGNTQLANIDNFAFYSCNQLSALTLPETVTNIGRYAFYGCESLTELTVPESIEHIGSYAFLGTDDITLYFIGETMPQYLDENWDTNVRAYYNGVVSIREDENYRYAVLRSGNIAIWNYLGKETSPDLSAVDLGAPITVICSHAFEGSNITSIVLPESLTTIQAAAFAHTKLTGITIPANVIFIGRDAFAFTELAELQFAANSSLAVIEQYAFQGTKQLTTVVLPASLTTLGTGVFHESGLQRVTFAAGTQLTEIPQKAFADTKLTEITLPDSVTLVGHEAFNNVLTLKKITFGRNDGIRLMSNAFYHTGLEELHIPANVTYIGEYCFVALNNLTEYSVDENNPNYTAVDGLLLTKNGRKLIAVPAGRSGSLTVPVSVEEIGFGAFEGSKLSEILFHEDANILSIGHRAFFRAVNITAISIPKSVVSIDYYAFAYCDNLHTVSFAEDNRIKGIYEGAFLGCASLKNIALPDSIVEISEFAFYGCTQLDRLPVTENSQLRGIYDYAFAYTGLSGEFTTPETLIDIGDYAFLGNRFTKVTIPDTHKKELVIGIGAFEDCNQLTEITLPFIGASYENKELPWFGYIFGAGSERANETHVPKSLKTVTITEGITTIYTDGFAFCTGLDAIHVPHSVSMLYSGAFYCTTASYELTNVIMVNGYDPYTATYGPYAISDHFGAGIRGKVTLAEGVTAIYDNTFENLEYITAVELPGSLKTVSSGAFRGCIRLQMVALREGVEIVDTGAFFGCISLLQVDLPESLQVISEDAFWRCNSLRRITIPAGVTEIRTDAFGECYNLLEVENQSDLPLSLNSREYGGVTAYAQTLIHKDGSKSCLDETGVEYVDTTDGLRFRKENGVYTLTAYLGEEETVYLPGDIHGQSYSISNFLGGTSIVISEGVTSLDEGAFRGNRTVRHISLPNSLTNIGAEAFYGCRNLESVAFSGNDISIGSEAFYACEKLAEVQLPSGCVSVGDYAFYGCINLESIRISENCSYIGESAFGDCAALKEIILPQDLSSLGMCAFINCTSLESIILPDALREIPQSCFEGCTALTQVCIPDRVHSIFGYAFRGCASLQKVQLSKNLFYIGREAFRDCPELQTLRLPQYVRRVDDNPFDSALVLEVDAENPDLQIIDGIMYNKPATTILHVSRAASSVIHVPEGITTLTEGAFRNCDWITEIVLPESLLVIDDYAFEGCSGLTNITLPENLQELGNYAFRYCTYLESIRLPERITSVPTGAFWGCSNLKQVYLPEDLRSIDPWAFRYCVSIREIELPDTVYVIDQESFEGCTNLHSIVLPDGIQWVWYGAFKNCSSLRSVNLPDSVEYLGQYCFSGCDSLTSITIPDGITAIPNGMFVSCPALEAVYLPEGVTHIGDFAFNNCPGLQQITLPSTLTSIGSNAFTGCGNLRDIHNRSDLQLLPGSFDYGGVSRSAYRITDKHGNISYLSGYEDFAYIDTADGFRFLYVNGNYTLIAYTGSETHITLPSQINGNGYNIQYFRGGVYVTVPDGISSLDHNAFRGNSTIISVTIADSVTKIGSNAFMQCASLETVTLPEGLTIMDYSLFEGCIHLKNVMIPDSVTYLRGGMFKGCCNLTEVTLPEGLLSIGSAAFYDCHSLTDLHIPDSVREIGSGAFTNSGIWNDESRRKDGMLIVDGWVIQVSADLRFLPAGNYRGAADGAFEDCVFLKTAIWSLNLTADSLETLFLHNESQAWLSSSARLKNIVITGEFDPEHHQSFAWMFANISGVTIFVEEKEDFVLWDEQYPGWNHGNRVVYGDDWVFVNFYDQNGNLIASEPKCTTEIVRLPVLDLSDDAQYTYTLLGWDMDDDGRPDSIPATVTQDTSISAVVKAQVREYLITFINPASGEIYLQQMLPYGATIPLPEEPTATEGFFEYWAGYLDEMTVTGNVTFAAKWHVHYFVGYVTAPTCTEQGYTTYVCTCGETYVDDYTDLLPHDFFGGLCRTCRAEDPSFEQPTCATTQETIYERIIAVKETYPEGTYFSQQFWYLWNTMYYWNGNWYYDGISCADFAMMLSDAAFGSSYITVISQDISIDRLRVGDILRLNGDAHSVVVLEVHEDFIVVAEGSCEDNAVHWDRIMTAQEVLAATDYILTRYPAHNYLYEYVEPTCTEQGYLLCECERCGDRYIEEYYDPWGHSYGSWYVEIAATCTEEGLNRRDCWSCDHYETKVVPAAGHSYTSAVTAPTCTEQGYTTHTCVNCNDFYVDSYVDALGHDHVVTDSKNATCTGEGYTTYTCHCGDSYTEILEATGHSYVDGNCEHCGEKDPNAARMGDANGDGTVNYLDAMLIAQYYVGDIGDEDLDLSAADVNGDGVVNYLDAMMVAQYYVGDIDSFPAEN